MRYFVLSFVIACVLVVGIFGFRGKMSRKPAIELFSDMDRQNKVRPQEAGGFFGDGRNSRLPVQGTVARGSHFLDTPLNTGMDTGTTNFVAVNPVKITQEFIHRGQQRYEINCTPCHGRIGDGNGITKKFGMAVVANLHDARIVQMTDGELFHVITNGRNLMGPYAGNITIEDRWAIVSYLRALQLSRLGTSADLQGQTTALAK